jgi:hypothetical protein
VVASHQPVAAVGAGRVRQPALHVLRVPVKAPQTLNTAS